MINLHNMIEQHWESLLLNYHIMMTTVVQDGKLRYAIAYRIYDKLISKLVEKFRVINLLEANWLIFGIIEDTSVSMWCEWCRTHWVPNAEDPKFFNRVDENFSHVQTCMNNELVKVNQLECRALRI